MRISVIIPACNEELLIESCLRHLQAQQRPADEIIVVDNNSTDRTAHLAAGFGVQVLTERMQGIWPAAAAGYDAATGDVIARIDADSLVPSDWLVRIEEHFRNEPEEAVTGPGVFYGCGRLLATAGSILYMQAYFVSIGLALGHPPLFASNFAMNRLSWERVRGKVSRTRADLHDDIDLSYPLDSVRYLPELTVGISARPLLRPASLPRRFAMGMRTLLLHWPEEAPWKRYL